MLDSLWFSFGFNYFFIWMLKIKALEQLDLP